MTKGKESEQRVPTDLRKALRANANAMNQWSDLTPLARRDFISWIEGAKQLETRKRRIEVACFKLVAGKHRPCCYAIVPMNLYRALVGNSKAKATWKDLTGNERRNFASWIDGAKQPETHRRRVERVPSILAAGKRRPF